MKVFEVREDVFKTEPLFIIDCSHEQLTTYLKRRFRVDAGENVGQVGQMFTYDRAPWRVVWCKKADAGVLLHEIFHLVTRVCYDKGIQIAAMDENSKPSDETAAYLFEFYAKAALPRVRKHPRLL